MEGKSPKQLSLGDGDTGKAAFFSRDSKEVVYFGYSLSP